jgi:hypothetical protein
MDFGWFAQRFRLIDDAERRRRGVAVGADVIPTDTASVADGTDSPADEPPSVPDDVPVRAEGPPDHGRTDDDDSKPVSKPEPGQAGEGSDGDHGDGLIRPDKLEAAIKWSAAGFTALAAVLAFLGYKEGVLDQALRIYPAASVAVMILLGIGVVGALFAQAVDPQARFLLWSLLALLLIMLVSASLFLPDIGDLSRGDPLIAEQSRSIWSQLSRPAGLGLILVFLVAAVITAALWGDRPGWARSAAGLALVSALAAGWLLAPRTIDPLTGDAGEFDTARLAAYLLTFALLAGLLLLAVVAFDRETTFSTMAGLTILAVAATSLGLYGATKVAVEAKSLRSLPQVQADIENKDGVSTVIISVTGSRVRGLRVVVGVNGVRRGGMPRTMEDPTGSPAGVEAPVWAALVRPGALDEIDRSIRVDVRPERWDQLTVFYCLASEDVGLDCGPNEPVDVATFRTPAPAKEIAQITAKLEDLGDGKVKARFSASDVAPGVLTRLEVCRQRADKHVSHVLDVSLAPDQHGDVTWEATVTAGRKGDRLMLRHTTCAPGQPCTTEWRTLSTFVNELESNEPVTAQTS